MFQFKIQQKVFEINGVKIGGQPCENPIVLIGSIFYHGHKVVLDEKTGDLQKEQAEKIIKDQEEISEKTKIPFMLDVVGSTKEAIINFIDFISEVSETPFLIDSTSAEVKIAGIKYASEVGLESRVIYNSLTPESKPEEFEAIKVSKVKSAILLAFESGVMTSKQRIEVLKKLLLKAQEAGITKPLLDTFVIDVPSLSLACKTILRLKGELGLPCGCGAHNAVATWKGLKKHFGAEAVKSCTVAVNLAPAVFGADFILYGPIEDCKQIFPAIYTIQTAYKYLSRIEEPLTF